MSLVDPARHCGSILGLQTLRAKPKGKVERPFRCVHEDFFLAMSIRNLDDLYGQLRHWLNTVANPRCHATTQRIVNDAFAEDRPQLRPLPMSVSGIGLIFPFCQVCNKASEYRLA